MSKYHSQCSEQTKQDTVNKEPKGTQPKLTSKPFCDCNCCTCKDCPNILKMLSITVTENSCEFRPKVGKHGKINNGETENFEDRAQDIGSLLENLNQDRACGCEVVARAVTSDVHNKMNLSDVRATSHSENTSAKDTKKFTQEQ